MESIDAKMEAVKLEAITLRYRERQRDYAAEIQALRLKSEKAKNLYINSLLTFEKCKEQVQNFETQIKELEAMQKKEKTIDLSKLEEALQEGWRGMYVDLPKEKKRGFWRILIKQIRIYKDSHIEYDLNL